MDFRFITRMRIAFLLILASSPVFPNDLGRKPPPKYDWTIIYGIAPVYGPVFFGSRYKGYSIFPDIRVNYKDKLFFSIPDGLGYNFILNDHWKYGPLIKFRFGRNDEKGGSPFLVSKGTNDINRLGDIGIATELGFFVQYNVDRIRIRSELKKGISEHNGNLMDFSFIFADRKGPISYNFGPRISIANQDFLNHYFGISIYQFARTGITPQRMQSGIFFIGLSGAITIPLSIEWAVTLFFSYDQLSKQIASSSLIENRGSEHQWNVGIGIGYRFGWNESSI